MHTWVIDCFFLVNIVSETSVNGSMGLSKRKVSLNCSLVKIYIKKLQIL